MQSVKINEKFSARLRIRVPILNNQLTFVKSTGLNGNKQGVFQNNLGAQQNQKRYSTLEC